MNAAELHAKLSVYLAQSPQNGSAEVVIKGVGNDRVWSMAGANDARGMVPGQHLLILLPDESVGGLEVRGVELQ